MTSGNRNGGLVGIALVGAFGFGCVQETEPVRVAGVEIEGVIGPVMLIGPGGGSIRQYDARVVGTNGKRVNGFNVVWTVSSPAIVTVTDDGLVTALAVGASYLTATVEDLPEFADSITLVVSPVPVANVTVTPRAIDLQVGAPDSETFQLLLFVHDSAGARLSGRTVAWTSTDPSVATVSAGGLVTAVGTGFTYVRAASEGKADTTEVTVLPPETDRTVQRPLLRRP